MALFLFDISIAYDISTFDCFALANAVADDASRLFGHHGRGVCVGHFGGCGMWAQPQHVDRAGHLGVGLVDARRRQCDQ